MTKIQVTHISVLQTSKVVAVLYLVVGFVYFPLLWLLAPTFASEEQFGSLWLLLPVFLGGATFIVFALMALLYNVVARWLGGVEFSLSSLSDVEAP